MVSNVLEVTPEELVQQLEQLRDSHRADPDYQRLRDELPADWPI